MKNLIHLLGVPPQNNMLKIYQIEKELKGKIREIDEFILRELQRDANETPLADAARHIIHANWVVPWQP